MGAKYPTPQECASFALRMVVSGIQFRIDAMNERNLPGISISKGFAQEIVRTCEGASRLLEGSLPQAIAGPSLLRPAETLKPAPAIADDRICDDCPPLGYVTHKTRCAQCPRLDAVCMAGIASNRPCRCDDTLRRCTICGFVVDTQYTAEKPDTNKSRT